MTSQAVREDFKKLMAHLTEKEDLRGRMLLDELQEDWIWDIENRVKVLEAKYRKVHLESRTAPTATPVASPKREPREA